MRKHATGRSGALDGLRPQALAVTGALIALIASCTPGASEVGSRTEAVSIERPGEQGRVTVCHRAGIGEAHTITVAAAALPAHLAHGDAIGACASGCASASDCADANACTTDECLPSGQCAHGPVDCDDGNPCTNDACAPAEGCTTAPAAGSCDDGNDCTSDDACVDGHCRGAAIGGCCTDASGCDDGDRCTSDSCSDHACSNVTVECGVADLCIAGFCDPNSGECGAAAVSCDDNDPCTIDACDPLSGCTHAPDPACATPCCATGNLGDCTNWGDGTRCTTGVLSGGTCVGSVARTTEVCNGVDDDCNGVADDVAVLGTECTAAGTSSAGECTAEYACLGVPGPGPGASWCVQVVGPAPEACNTLDDDCDGVVDEGIVGAPCCEHGDLDACDQLGNLTCVGGAMVCAGSSCSCFDGDACTDDACTADGCVFAPKADCSCCATGFDADCTNTGGGTRCQLGELAGGFCVGSVAKSVETCNGIDDDCDGLTDDIALIGAECTSAVINTTGACTARYACNGAPGSGPAGLTCVQEIGPAPETCNGVDDNCNGVVDDQLVDVGTACCHTGDLGDCTTPGVRACVNGTLSCVGSS